MTDTLIQRLSKLEQHLSGLDSGSGEAALLRETISALQQREITGKDNFQAILEAITPCFTVSKEAGGDGRTVAFVGSIACVAELAANATKREISFIDTLEEAKKVVKTSPLYRKFIDGTPLANDIAVWMTEFAIKGGKA